MIIEEWYRSTVGDDSENAVATKAQIHQRTLNGQRRKGSLSAETVVAVAKAYGRDVLDALVVCGLITEEDIRRHGIRESLASATDEEIANEVYRRLVDGSASGDLTDGHQAVTSTPIRTVPDWADDVAASDPSEDED